MEKLERYQRLDEEYDPELDILETGGARGIALAEEILMEQRVENLVNNAGKTKRDRVYQTFLSESDRISYFRPEVQRNILEKYFPGRFGRTGRTPVSQMDDQQILGTFNGLVNYARKRVYHQ
ncbi:MAG: hypothetical protein KKB79_00795 [Nanoarchaeota archaeon]|nr:hypothetical protein [Nanoarchaeota archaeon]